MTVVRKDKASLLVPTPTEQVGLFQFTNPATERCHSAMEVPAL